MGGISSWGNCFEGFCPWGNCLMLIVQPVKVRRIGEKLHGVIVWGGIVLQGGLFRGKCLQDKSHALLPFLKIRVDIF